jgi:hypothetical protein
MSAFLKTIWSLGLLAVAVLPAFAQKAEPGKTETTSAEPTSIVITFKDGHQQSFSMSEIARIQYVGQADATIGPDYFLGKWEVGDGSGGTFLITFETNGEATRSLGAIHGIWTIEGDEARISWDDGWHDVIRKAGDGHEKVAFWPGTTYTDQPNNVTNARRVEP